MALSISRDLTNVEIYTANLQDIIDLTRKLLERTNHFLAIKLDIEKAITDGKVPENLHKEEEKAQEEFFKAHSELGQRNDLLSMSTNVYRDRPLPMSILNNKTMNLDKVTQEDRDFIRENETRIQWYMELVRERKRRVQQLQREVDIAMLEVRFANQRAQTMRDRQ